VGADVSGLKSIDIRIADLGGATLGLAACHTIWLAVNAAGWGWFIDPTPWDDSEFTTPGDQGEQGRMDLLTVLEHEIGHLLGRSHEATGVMQETLAAGTRRSVRPDAAAGTGALSAALMGFESDQGAPSVEVVEFAPDLLAPHAGGVSGQGVVRVGLGGLGGGGRITGGHGDVTSERCHCVLGRPVGAGRPLPQW
jgi:hypothetical protein